MGEPKREKKKNKNKDMKYKLNLNGPFSGSPFVKNCTTLKQPSGKVMYSTNKGEVYNAILLDCL